MTQNITKVVLDVLPQVESNINIYFTVILSSDSSLNLATITNTTILYGNVTILSPNIIKISDNLPVALGITATLFGNTYFDILYIKAVYPIVLPNNTQRIIQKIPYGVFKSLTTDTIQGQLFNTIGLMLNDYYAYYFIAQDNLYSSIYSQSSEYEYNGTKGLLSNSIYPNKLISLLAALDIVKLNAFDLELFISKYIYYRLGISCPVYIDDHVIDPGTYWILNVSSLNVNTILAPGDAPVIITNVKWIIYNSSSFTESFKNEIIDLIIKISRADIQNSVVFNNIVNPVDDNFTLIGPTYLLDPRLLYDRCTAYISDDSFPLNAIGYIKNT